MMDSHDGRGSTDESWALITGGRRPLIDFEVEAIRQARLALGWDWSVDGVDPALARRMPRAISVRGIQERMAEAHNGGGFARPGAPEIVSELARLGVVRPATDEELAIIRPVTDGDHYSGRSEDADWFIVIPSTLHVLYPES